MIPCCILYLLASELIPAQPSRGEVLLFKRRKLRERLTRADDETGDLSTPQPASQETRDTTVDDMAPPKTEEAATPMPSHGANFYWESVDYEIKTRGGPRNILTDVNGWVKPGTLTALMVRPQFPGQCLQLITTLLRISLVRVKRPYLTLWPTA